MQRLLITLVGLLLLAATAGSQTIVERHGQLTVDGNRIKDECGRVAQLKGMSYFWSQWEGKEYYNANAVKWLRDDWKVEVVRAAVAVRGEDDYTTNPTVHYDRAVAVIDGAVQHGIYAIADFHAHDADQYLTQAKTFFRQISARYQDRPNIIYEIWNEPIGERDDVSARATWTRVKSYAREVISVIRDNDPDGLIVVGTPFYSQRVDIATENPLTTDSKGRPVGNVAYTIHAYAGTHGQTERDWGNIALKNGYALFMTEGGRTAASGNGGIDAEEWNRWEAWMDANGISYAKWSLSNKNETSSSLQPGAPANGGWTTAQLRPEGQWNRTHFRTVNANPPSVCGTPPPPAGDVVQSLTAPGSVQQGQTITVGFTYSASANRDIQIVFQRDNSPYTIYTSRKIDVSAGSGSRSITLTIPSTVPVAVDDYHVQVYLTTDNGTWADRFSNVARNNIDVTAAATTTNSNLYTDDFTNSWASWSWGGTATPRDGGIKYAGSYSFKYDFGAGGAISLRHPSGLSGDNLVRLEFWARTGSGSATFRVSGSYDEDYANRGTETSATITTTWKKFSFTKAQLGGYNWYRRFFIAHPTTGVSVYLDNVRLVYASSSALSSPQFEVAAPSVRVPGIPGDMTLFPNPSRGEVTVTVEDVAPGMRQLNLVVMDISGRVLLSRRQEAASGPNRFDVLLPPDTAPGLYLVRVYDDANQVNYSRHLAVQ